MTSASRNSSYVRGLLIDFDGTIAETERFGHRVAYNAAFAEFGLDWYWDEALYADLLSVAGGKERIRYYVDRYKPGALENVDASFVEALHREKTRRFSSIDHIPLRPGILRLLSEVHAANVPIAIATTASLDGVRGFLAHHPALSATIDLIAADNSVERKKPAPDVYEWALSKLERSAKDCVAIEDSQIGLRAAKAAGLTTLITVSDYTASEDFSGAAAVLSDLGSPERPARSIFGPAPPNGVVDLAFLDSLPADANIR